MKRATVWILVLVSQNTLAQGITNPAGGGLIPVAFHILIGLVPLVYVFLSLAVGERIKKVPVISIRNLLIIAFLIIGFVEISISDHHDFVLFLYVEMLLIVVGVISISLRFHIRATGARCTWGWRDRPEAFFRLPLLGVVQIFKVVDGGTVVANFERTVPTCYKAHTYGYT